MSIVKDYLEYLLKYIEGLPSILFWALHVLLCILPNECESGKVTIRSVFCVKANN